MKMNIYTLLYMKYEITINKNSKSIYNMPIKLS